MAPNKKKKKAPSNPNRGFSTVSVASKPRTDDTPDDPKPPREENEVSVTPEKATSLPKQVPFKENEAASLQDMSREDLETHLEAAELQLLVDKNGSMIKKNSSRVSSRLQTERRILRSQASRLNVDKWLFDVDVHGILQLFRAQTSEANSTLFGTNSTSKLSLTQDDLCLKLWELRLTLQQLGFDGSQVEAVLSAFARSLSSGEIPDPDDAKGGYWCLEEALGWLALEFPAEELPSYEHEEVKSNTKDGGLSTDTASLSETPDRTPVVSGVATPEEGSGNTPKGPRFEYVPDVTSQHFGHPSDSLDSEIEPEDLLPRYLAARTQLYELQSEHFDPRSAELRPANPTGELSTSLSHGPKVRELRTLLKRIESDVLFDRYAATQQWKVQMRTLAQKIVPRNRTTKIASTAYNPADKLQGQPEEQSPSSQDSTETPEDQDDLFGSIFATREGELIPSEDNTSAPNNTTMILRDFGKWTGTSPRRVLEDACKARDPRSTLSYKPVGTSSYSNRHSLEITWSKGQTVAEPMALPVVTYTLKPRLTSVTMTGLATPTLLESESYVSTVALFLLFASSPKEEKCHLRLPAAWRELWFEFVALKKDHDDAEDKHVLQNIRNMVQSSMASMGENENSVSRGQNSHQLAKKVRSKAEPARRRTLLDPELIKTSWNQKATSPTYQKMLSSRSSLPIWGFKLTILETLNEHQALIICGETGCGKSTQVPTFILEQEMMAGRECRIWVTEPRRISAISLAQRVSEELGERKADIGTRNSDVGYAIRLESKVNDQTRLVYATTGVIVRMLEHPEELRSMTHLILDEVHERSIDSDFLLIVLRRLIEKRPDLKIVLMSATLDAKRFSKYLGGAPICNVPGRTFPVEVNFLEDAIEMTGYSAEQSRGAAKDDLDEADTDDIETDHERTKSTTAKANNGVKLSRGIYSIATQSTLKKYDEYRINYDLMIMILDMIATIPQMGQYSKAILVFMPGMFEIRRLTDRILSHPTFAEGWIVHTLHSTVASEEQGKAFLIPPKGMRKIVVATNIAETGITIPDVTAVIDSGKEKVMRFDERRQLSRLVESFISRANAKQRRGRAGRVQSGICFHLFSRDRHDRMFSEQQTPEMLRLSLQDLVLRVKICNLGGIEQTLSEALDPPSTKNIRRAIEALKDVKALTNAEDLTPLGRQLARLPLDVFLGKLVLNGLFFQCLDITVTIAAILSSKSPFSSSFFPRSQVDLARFSFQKGDSDLITTYNAYAAWKRVRTSANMSEFQFCLKNCLSPKTLAGIEDLKVSLYVSLVEGGLLKPDVKTQASLKRARWFTGRNRYFFSIPENLNLNSDNDLIVNSVIAWSFFPKLLVREGKGWRNVTNNQTISLSPASVNKRVDQSVKWLSFYNILQSSSQYYNAYETSAVEELAIALLCGDAEFKMYSGVITIDGNRIRFAVKDWKTMVALKLLGSQIRDMLTKSFRNPGRKLTEREQKCYDMWQHIFSRHLKEVKESG